jgi:hypothetical protein
MRNLIQRRLNKALVIGHQCNGEHCMVVVFEVPNLSD